MEQSESKNPSPVMKIIGLAVMAAAIAIILLPGSERITAQAVERHLEHFRNYVSQEAAASGYVARFSAGAIAIEGWGYDTYGVVDDVMLEISEPGLLQGGKWSFSTGRMKVEPDRLARGRTYFIFPEPVNIVEDGGPLTIASFSSPPRYSYFDGRENGVHTVVHTLQLPEQITLTPTTGAGDPQPLSRTVITYDPSPLVRMTRQPELGTREIDYALSNLRIASEHGEETDIAAVSSHFAERQDEQGRVIGNYTLALSDIVLIEHGQATPPYGVQAELSYSGQMPADAAALLAPRLEEAEITIHKLVLLGNDFRITARGSLRTAKDDPLPSGALDIEMEHAQRFLASGLVPEQMKETVARALQKVIGQPLGASEKSTFALRREKHGALYVGNVTFEELAASVLADILKSPPSPPNLSEEP